MWKAKSTWPNETFRLRGNDLQHKESECLPSAWPSRSSSYVLKYNIPKQKEKTNKYTHPMNPDTPALRPEQTTNPYCNFCEGSPSVCCSLWGFCTGIATNCNHVVFCFARLDWSGLSSNPDSARIASYPSQRHWSTRSYLERTEFCWTAT